MKISKSSVIPLLPLERGSVLLPGATVRILVGNRADVAAILAHIYSQTAASDSPSLTVGCVPLASPFLSQDGQRLIEGEDEQKAHSEPSPTEPFQAKKEDIFGYGTLAKVSGVQGRRKGELALVVEGLCRFKIEKVNQEQPYFEARVSVLNDEGMSQKREGFYTD